MGGFFIKQELPINNQITESQVQVIDENGQKLGVLPIADALNTAYDKNLDLNGKVLSIVCDVVYILGFIDERAHKTNINALVKLDEVKDDNINHPHRYTKGKIECIDAIESAVCDLKGIEAFCTGNVIKYVWRWKEKEQVDSLKKAGWYLNHLIKKVEENASKSN